MPSKNIAKNLYDAKIHQPVTRLLLNVVLGRNIYPIGAF
jgi:hypothetical protein